METKYFYEVQYFRNKWIFALALFICIFMEGLMIYGLVSQVFYGIPFGSHPLSDTGMCVLSVFATVFTFCIPLLMYITKLITEIKSDGIYFRYFPFHSGFKKITLSEIEKFEVKEFHPIRDYGGWGIRKKFSTNEIAYIIGGNHGLLITCKSGKKLLIGTQKVEELKSALKKLR